MRPRLLDLGNGGTAFIDAEDADLVAGYGWYQTANGYVGAMTTDRTGKRKLLLLHRLLMGEPEGRHVDHLNGDKLDNRRENLRVATYQQNQANRRSLGRNNTSGVRGVQYMPQLSASKPWRAQITVDRRNLHLGLFATRAEAIQTRRQAEHEHYGELCP